MKVCKGCKESKEISEYRVARGKCKACETTDRLNRERIKKAIK